MIKQTLTEATASLILWMIADNTDGFPSFGDHMIYYKGGDDNYRNSLRL